MKEVKLATEKQIKYIVSLVKNYGVEDIYDSYVNDGEPTEKLKNLPIWEAKKLIEELKSYEPKKYVWTFKEEYKNNEYVQKLNELLSKEEGEQPENFDQIPLNYNYYFMEGEERWFDINLGLLIDNFEIYENAEEVYKEYLDENNRIKKHNKETSIMLEKYKKHPEEFKIVKNSRGDIRLEVEDVQKIGDIELPYTYYLDPKNPHKIEEKSLLMFLLEDWCPSHEILGGDLITSGEYYW